MTLAERILDLLRKTSRPLDDDEIARRLSVEPRQSVNQACRRLVAVGALRRVTGPDRKIVNLLAESSPLLSGTSEPDDAASLGTSSLPVTAPSLRVAGDSGEQRRAERLMLAELSAELGVELLPKRLQMGPRVRVEIDGADESGTVLVEAWAHQGPAKAAQKHKVLADALKLVWVAQRLKTAPLLLLCLSDEQAARTFVGERSWSAAALADLGVQVRVVSLPPHIREELRAAQARQYR